MSPSFQQLLLVLLIVVLIFGAGRLPRVMGDVAKGIKEFRRGMREEGTAEKSDTMQAIEEKKPASGSKPTKKSKNKA